MMMMAGILWLVVKILAIFFLVFGLFVAIIWITIAVWWMEAIREVSNGSYDSN